MKVISKVAAFVFIAGAITAANGQQPTAAVYKANCAPCHGAAGDANTPAGKTFKVPSFSSDVVLKESDAHMLAVAKDGKGKMPAWHDKLSEEQLKDLISYVHSLQKK